MVILYELCSKREGLLMNLPIFFCPKFTIWSLRCALSPTLSRSSPAFLTGFMTLAMLFTDGLLSASHCFRLYSVANLIERMVEPIY